MSTVSSSLNDLRVLVMGLGSHGGGVASARYCAESGAAVTVTDLRPEADLAESLSQLDGLPIRYVLGEHREQDFRNADLVVKNPAVPRDSPYLLSANRVETDISLFLNQHHGEIYAITGTKGKSTTAAALHFILSADDPSIRLGGNITVSPLSFASELSGTEAIVLELSSFQLGDLLLTPAGLEDRLPRFALGAVTNLLHDHQDYYQSMEGYAADKSIIFRHQQPSDWVILSTDDRYSREFRPPVEKRTIRVTSGDLSDEADAGTINGRGFARVPSPTASLPVELVPHSLKVVGGHQHTNLLIAATAAALLGRDPGEIRRRISSFGGLAHRLEFVRSVRGVDYYNDSAATIAEAARLAVASFDRPIHLIAGGSDKGVPLDLFSEISQRVESIHLIAGTATHRISSLLRNHRCDPTGPHDTLKEAVSAASAQAKRGDVVLLSPGCASFGLFRNEFDRGDQFRAIVNRVE